MVTKRWRIENGIGHWELYLDGKFVASCDDGELSTTLDEVKSEANTVS